MIQSKARSEAAAVTVIQFRISDEPVRNWWEGNVLRVSSSFFWMAATYFAIELFVDKEVAQATGGKYPDADISRKCVDEFADRDAHILTALRCRLVRGIVGVQENRNDRDHCFPIKRRWMKE